jgi:hypothetical protein
VSEKRQSIEPTYDSRETGPRYSVTTRLGDRTTEFRKPIPGPFVNHEVTLGWLDVLRFALRRQRPTVSVLINGDPSVVEDVLELDGNYLGRNCTRRDEFSVTVGAALHTFAAGEAS